MACCIFVPVGPVKRKGHIKARSASKQQLFEKTFYNTGSAAKTTGWGHSRILQETDPVRKQSSVLALFSGNDSRIHQFVILSPSINSPVRIWSLKTIKQWVYYPRNAMMLLHNVYMAMNRRFFPRVSFSNRPNINRKNTKLRECKD